MAEAKSSKKRTYEEVLASTKAIVAEKHRKRVEAAAQPGETFAEVENRLKADDAAKERETAQEKARQQPKPLRLDGRGKKGSRTRPKPRPRRHLCASRPRAMRNQISLCQLCMTWVGETAAISWTWPFSGLARRTNERAN